MKVLSESQISFGSMTFVPVDEARVVMFVVYSLELHEAANVGLFSFSDRGGLLI